MPAPAQNPQREDRANRVAWLAVVLCSGISTWLRFRYLSASDAPVGVDGFYYPIQVRSLLSHGQLYYSSSPLALWLMAGVAHFSEPVFACKLMASAGTAAIGIPLMGLGRRLGAGPLAAATAAIAATTAPSCLYFSAEFAKNGIGLTVLAGFLWALAAADKANTPWRWAVAALLLVLTALTHKLAVVMALFFAGAVFIGRREYEYIRVLLPALGLAAVITLIAMTPGALADLGGLWTISPAWGLPIYRLDGVPIHFGGDAVIALGGALAVLFAMRQRRRSAPPMLWAAIAWTVPLALPFLDVSDENGLGPRLRLTLFVPGAMCAGWVLSELLRHKTLLVRGAACAAIAALLIIARPATPDEGVAKTDPEMLRAIGRLPARLSKTRTLIVPSRQLVFAAVWLHETDSRMRPEPVPQWNRLRLLPHWYMSPELVVNIRAASEEPPAGMRPPLALHPDDALFLVAVEEPLWQWLLTRLSPTMAEHYRRWPTL